MHYIRFLTRSAALVFLLAVSMAMPGIRHIDHGLLYGRSSQEINAIGDKSRNLTAPLPDSIQTSKRMMPGLTPVAQRARGQLNFSSLKKLRPMLPIAQASLFLHDFYASVALKAGGVWAQLPQEQYWSITEGQFELKFIAIGDTVAWDAVEEMAETLKNLAIRGFTNLFEATFMDASGRRGLKVALTLIDLSSSSEGTDFREGSVPSVTGPDMSYQQYPGTRRRR